MNAVFQLVLIHSLTYLPFLFLLWRAKAKQGLRLFDERGFAANLPVLIELQLAGIFLFGILPFVFDHPGALMLFDGIDVNKPSTWLTIVVLVASLLITPQILKSKLKALPQQTNSFVSPGVIFYTGYFFSRILFIAAYECWFRGFLLMDSIAHISILWAILINIILYAVLHLANGKDEVIACLPYGILLCILCIWQGGVWPAVIIHLALTIPYESGYVRRLKQIIAYPI